MNTNEMANVDAWLDLHDPKINSMVNNAGIPLSKILSTLDMNTLQPAVVNAMVLGRANYITEEKVLKDTLQSREPSELPLTDYEKGLKEFRRNPLVGCTSVLDMARVASGYDPNGDIENTKNIEAFNDYLRRVLSCPFFHLKMSDYTEYSRQEKSWEVAITEISNLFEGLENEDKSKVTKSIKDLASAVASNKNTKQSKNLFTISSIYAPDNRNLIETYMYSSSIQMEEHASKGSDSKQTDMKIRKVTLTFNTSLWDSYAEKVFKKHVKLVEEWLDDNTTKAGTENIALCFEKTKQSV